MKLAAILSIAIATGCVTADPSLGTIESNDPVNSIAGPSQIPGPPIDGAVPAESGTRTMLLSGHGCVFPTGSAAYVFNAGFVVAYGATGIMCALPMHAGDVLHRVTYGTIGNGLVDVQVAVHRTRGGVDSVLALAAMTDVAPSYRLSTLDVPVTLTEDDTIFVQFNTQAAGLQVGAIRVVYTPGS